SIPARGIKNIHEFAAMPDLVAVFGGRFSPVLAEELPAIKETNTLLMAVWSSGDFIVTNDMKPNFAFRLSLRDSLAMPFMLRHATAMDVERVGLLLTNTAWGRSNLAAAEKYLAAFPKPVLVGTAWYNWRDQSLIEKYLTLEQAGAQAILLVANDDEGATLVREIATLPESRRMPILSHWGVTGGDFVGQTGESLFKVDFRVIQTFSFFEAAPHRLAPVLATARTLFGVKGVEDFFSPVGTAHAYDMTHILARAIDLAGSTDRAAVRDALERIPEHRGLIKDYRPPFSAGNHEALGSEQLLMARYRNDGVLVPIR
ncbi:MAG: ABC transporter substrate-binding protein, partial [Rhodospirillales bacterium]|nr:ABC transporter substrate-binding protein [Rhodospirillales bacterium]